MDPIAGGPHLAEVEVIAGREWDRLGMALNITLKT